MTRVFFQNKREMDIYTQTWNNLDPIDVDIVISMFDPYHREGSPLFILPKRGPS